MRISDWSSDVCSSDLIGARGQAQRHAFADLVAAERHIAATLRRRGTAEGRIGVPYRPIGARGESRISPESRHAVAQLLTISAAHAIARPLCYRTMSEKHCRLVNVSDNLVSGSLRQSRWSHARILNR